ncbi:MAG: thiamine pyrophosphate-dependent enzyme [Anaerolineae bacterium]|jgi:pyruvate ferredoxin oxidoreductase beta subunit
MATSLALKELAKRGDRLSPGHRLCAGCTAPVVARMILNAIDEPVVVANATGCLEVSTALFPYTAWRVPWIHSAFENAAATIAGVESMYQSLKRQGKIDRDIKFIAFGGDGGTYDIGLQALSGALERGHKMLYVCYDNEAYMNTGIQRSSATPMGANTTTTPKGKQSTGKKQWRKDLTAIVAAHHVAYAAQASPHRWKDLMTKARKGAAADGPAFLSVLAPCNRGWRFETSDGIKAAELAVETCFWPLYEVENGKWALNYKPKQKLPVTEWLKTEGRFQHLFKDEREEVLEAFQREVDGRWEQLLKLCSEA